MEMCFDGNAAFPLYQMLYSLKSTEQAALQERMRIGKSLVFTQHNPAGKPLHQNAMQQLAIGIAPVLDRST